MSSPSKPSGPIDALFNSSADRTIAHLNRVLSTTAGADSTLLLTGYSLAFISAQLNKLANIGVRQLAEKMAANASATASLKPGETLVTTQAIPPNSGTARLLNTAASMKTFSGMCSDVRMFMRLWGLLKIWAGFKAAYYGSSKMDPIVRVTTWGKLLSLLGYYVLEHGFYLGSKGVLKRFTPAQLGKMFAASIWIFGGYLVLDFVRLYRVSQLAARKRSAGAASDEKEDKALAQAESRAWWNALQVDLAYTPLTFHWGLPGGVVSDATVGALGAWAGWVGFSEAWRNTA